MFELLFGKQPRVMQAMMSTPVLWLACGSKNQELEYLSCYFIGIKGLQNDEGSRRKLKLSEWNTSFTCFLQIHVTSLTLWGTVLLKSRTSYECGFCDLVLLWIVSLHHLTCWAGLSWQRVMVSSRAFSSWPCVFYPWPFPRDCYPAHSNYTSQVGQSLLDFQRCRVCKQPSTL